jgi:hypothetical protein
MKSFNIVAETAQFVNLVYSNVNQQNIELVTQLFETLNEFTVVGSPQELFPSITSRQVAFPGQPEQSIGDAQQQSYRLHQLYPQSRRVLRLRAKSGTPDQSLGVHDNANNPFNRC